MTHATQYPEAPNVKQLPDAQASVVRADRGPTVFRMHEAYVPPGHAWSIGSDNNARALHKKNEAGVTS